MEWAFGKRMTPQERLRKHQRALQKTERELEREGVKLENQEKKLIQDIKKSAKNGQMGACKIQAKDLVRTRRFAPPPFNLLTPRPPNCSGHLWLSNGHPFVGSDLDISKNSTTCAPSSKPSAFASRPFGPTSR